MKLAGRLRSFDGLLALVLILAAAVLSVPRLADYLEEHVHVGPLMKARAALGRAPRLPAAVRVIVVDDTSLKTLGRAPSFSEWTAIAGLLRGAGFERVLLQEPLDLEGPSSVALARPGLFLAVGVASMGPRSARALAAGAVPSALTLDGVAPWPFAGALLAPDPSTFSVVSALGSNTIDHDTSLRVAPGLFLGEDRIVPHLAFHASPSVTWKDGRIVTAAGTVPRSSDDKLYVDYLPLLEVLNKAVPVRGFYAGDKLSPTLPPAVAQRVQGGTIAVLVPAAFSGSRHVTSPIEGLVPSYVTLLSLVGSVLDHRYLSVPARPWQVLGALVIPLFFALRAAGTRAALLRALALLAAYGLFAAVGFALRGWLLPNASVALLGLVGLTVRFGQHFTSVVVARGRLENELALGRTVQELLLPAARRERMCGWDIVIEYRPYGALAGDWFQTWRGERQAVVAIGDVVGKGASASLATAAIAGIWQDQTARWATKGVDPQGLADALESMILNVFKERQNSTLSLAVLEADGRARLATYSAPEWLLLEPGKAPRDVRTGRHNPLGMGVDTTPMTPTEVRVASGGILVAYSDGVADFGPAKRALTKRLAQLDLAAPDVEERIIAAASEISATMTLPDDFTLMIARYRSDTESQATKT